MFRALLWKEWRELWISLPIAAAFSALAFRLALPWNLWKSILSASLWLATFAPWLLLAAVYIPTHLYSREKEMRNWGFLVSRPVDRFRLWWSRFFIGLTILAAVGLVLYGVTVILGHSHPKAGGYEQQLANLLWRVSCIALILYSVSSLASACIKKQVGAILLAIVIIVFPLNFYMAFPLLFDIHKKGVSLVSGPLDYSTVCALVLCPPLLFAALLIFAGRSFRRQTGRAIALGYGVSALIAILPIAVGLSNVSPKFAEAFERMPRHRRLGPAQIHVLDVSADGNRALLKASPEDALVSVDLADREVHMIEKKGVAAARLDAAGDKIVYTREGKAFLRRSASAMLVDFEGGHKKRLLKYFWLSSENPLPMWSVDNNYLGMVRNQYDFSGMIKEGGLVAISDPEGRIVAKYNFPNLEEVELWPLGWDYASRFYFARSFYKREGRVTTYWRAKPGGPEPEPVPFLAGGVSTRCSMSPDGVWLAIAGCRSKCSEGSGLWLYDISNETEITISEKAQSVLWSRDGAMLACLDNSSPDPSEEEDRIPSVTIYEPATNEGISTLLGTAPPSIRLVAWSPSNRYVLLRTIRQYHGEAREFVAKLKKLEDNKVFLFSIETRQIVRVAEPDRNWITVHWIADDRLLWGVKDRLITTEIDGSDPQEIFRIEKDKFHFKGEKT